MEVGCAQHIAQGRKCRSQKKLIRGAERSAVKCRSQKKLIRGAERSAVKAEVRRS